MIAELCPEVASFAWSLVSARCFFFQVLSLLSIFGNEFKTKKKNSDSVGTDLWVSWRWSLAFILYVLKKTIEKSLKLNNSKQHFGGEIISFLRVQLHHLRVIVRHPQKQTKRNPFLTFLCNSLKLQSSLICFFWNRNKEEREWYSYKRKRALLQNIIIFEVLFWKSSWCSDSCMQLFGSLLKCFYSLRVNVSFC